MYNPILGMSEAELDSLVVRLIWEVVDRSPVTRAQFDAHTNKLVIEQMARNYVLQAAALLDDNSSFVELL